MPSQLAPVRSILARRALLRISQSQPATPWRTYSTAKPSNPTKDFYKTFTRPVAKVMLMAVLTYQLAYFGWMVLETEELKAEAAEEISKLEGQVEEYKKKTKTDEGKGKA